MTISLKHTVNVTAEIFTPCHLTGNFYNVSARRFNLVRLAETGEFNAEQIKSLSKVVMFSEGKGDCWTAILETNLGASNNSASWMHCEDTLIPLAQEMVNRA